MLEDVKIGFLGAGNMAEALVRGLLVGDAALGNRILAADISPDRRELFARTLDVDVTDSNSEVVQYSDIIVVAVKPQNMKDLFDEVGASIGDRHMVLSIMAGIRIADIEARCGAGARVVRAMPNTALLVGCGAGAIAPGSRATDTDLEHARDILGCAGEVLGVDEALMDAVTALSGSGPAYFFYVVEAMVDAAQKEGMDGGTALALATQTMLGAARLLAETKLAPEELRRRVTSPGGTTAAAVAAFDDVDMKGIISGAVRAAAARSRELGDELAK